MTSGQFASVPIDFIFVDRDKRQRKEIKSVDDLATSIAAVGLINPPVIERSGELRAGERRWTACRQLGWTSIPIQWIDELDEASLQQVELEENLRRVGLDWKDECAAIARYHALRREHDPEWSQERTGEALGMSKQVVNNYLGVATALDSGDKRVNEAPKFSTARGIVQRTNERKKAATAAAIQADIQPEKPAPIIPLLNTDFIEWANAYTGQPFNLLHCDFPYGVNADKHNQGQGAAMGGYADDFGVYTDLLICLKSNMDTLIAPSAHLMFWFSMDYYQYTLDSLTEMGWIVNPFPLMWHKSDNTGILPDPKRGPRRTYETAFFASRGDRPIVTPVANSVAWPGQDKSIHMSEKPRGMLKHFLRMAVDEYTRFLDPTAGSANAVRVAAELGAGSVLGLERDEEFFNRAKEAWNDGE